MTKSGLTRRLWTPATAMGATVLLFAASVGMVFRSAYEALVSIVSVPTIVVAVGFGVYCAVVVTLVFGVLMRRGHPNVPRILLIAVPLVAVAGVVVLTLLTPDSIDARADRDDALDIAVRELAAGRSPWGVPTPLGDEHLPSPLLGGVLLAAPVVFALGSSALQGALWLGIAVACSLRYLGPRLTTVAVVLLLASPIMVNELLFQSDLWVNAVILAIAGTWAWRSSDPLAVWPMAGSALLYGLALADRFVLAVVLIPALALVWRTAGRGPALAWGGGSVLLAAALTVAPWLIFPGSVEQTMRNVGKGDSTVIPYSGLILAVAMLTVAVVLTIRASSPSQHFWSASVALAVLPAFEMVTESLDRGTLTINGYTHVAYSAAFLVFGIVALITPSDPRQPRNRVPMRTAVALGGSD